MNTRSYPQLVEHFQAMVSRHAPIIGAPGCRLAVKRPAELILSLFITPGAIAWQAVGH